jgi:hypothetical protein
MTAQWEGEKKLVNDIESSIKRKNSMIRVRISWRYVTTT